MSKRVRLVWTPTADSDRLRRQQIDPDARDSWKTASLAWVKKHAQPCMYRVRWWAGPTGHDGRWHEHTFALDSTPRPSLADVKSFAQTVAATTTPWEVEIALLGRTHGNTGYAYGTVVWVFGEYKRDDETSRRLRGEA